MANKRKARGPSHATIVRVRANNDNNGNPRRGWIVHTTPGQPSRFVDEGYMGDQALAQVDANLQPFVPCVADVPRVPGRAHDVKRIDWERIDVIADIEITPAQYRALKKGDA